MKREELKREVNQVVSKMKNACLVDELLQVASLLQRSTDKTAYAELTEEDWNRLSVIRNVLLCKDAGAVKRLSLFTHAVMNQVPNRKSASPDGRPVEAHK